MRQVKGEEEEEEEENKKEEEEIKFLILYKGKLALQNRSLG